VIAYEKQISISGVGFDIGCGNIAVRLDTPYADPRQGRHDHQGRAQYHFVRRHISAEPCPFMTFRPVWRASWSLAAVNVKCDRPGGSSEAG
jgi:hypothetical protein